MRLILQFCLLLLVLLGAETHAWGKVDVGQNTASGGLPLILVDCTDGNAPPALITQGEPGPWDYEPAPDVCNGPNLYAYVKQNPWTSFDPDGLVAFQVHNPHAAWNPDIKRITESRDYQQGYWSAAQTGALAFLAAPLAVAAVYAGPAVVAREIADEAVDQVFEKVTGVPLPPTSPTEFGAKLLKKGGEKLAKKAGENTAQKIVKQTEEQVEKLFRGVPDGTDKADMARKGIVEPRGTATDGGSLIKHVQGEEVASGVTSWTPDRDIAKRFSGSDGIIVEVPKLQVQNQIVPRPPVQKYQSEKEVLIRGTVKGKPTKP